MAVTSDTLFHFTKSRANIENILTERFKLSYCTEYFKIANTASGNLYIPMVSFCDLPLGQIKNHIVKYGNFAIGLTKEWGIKNKLNPVLYLETNSIISKDVSIQMDSYEGIIRSLESLVTAKTLNVEQNKHVEDLFNNYKKNLNSYKNLFRFIKNYKGDLIRGNKTYKNYRFYDEREWRFIPEMDSIDIKWNLSEEEYKKYRGTTKKKNLLDKPILNFTSTDIKYIIVKSEKDIPPLIRKIKSIHHLCSTSNHTDVLITKILTVDTLNKDF